MNFLSNRQESVIQLNTIIYFTNNCISYIIYIEEKSYETLIEGDKEMTKAVEQKIRENVQVFSKIHNIQIQKSDKFYYITDGFIAIVAKRFYTEARAIEYASKNYGLVVKTKQVSNIPDELCEIMEAE
jgi:hypothetical protein